MSNMPRVRRLKDDLVFARIEADLKRKLEELAAAKGTKLSAEVREACLAHVKAELAKA